MLLQSGLLADPSTASWQACRARAAQPLQPAQPSPSASMAFGPTHASCPLITWAPCAKKVQSERADPPLGGHGLCAKDSKMQRVIDSRGRTGGLQAHVQISAGNVQIRGQAVISAGSSSFQAEQFRRLLLHARELRLLHSIRRRITTGPRHQMSPRRAASCTGRQFHTGDCICGSWNRQPTHASSLLHHTPVRCAEYSECARRPVRQPLHGCHTTVRMA